MNKFRVIILTMLAGIIALPLIMFSSAGVAEAGCWPHYCIASTTDTETVPGYGTATAKAQIRGWPFWAECINCRHGESNSNTQTDIDYIYWFGKFSVDWGDGYTESYSGYGYCNDCTGGYWKSQAHWFADTYDVILSTQTYHQFNNIYWWWTPQLYRAYVDTCYAPHETP